GWPNPALKDGACGQDFGSRPPEPHHRGAGRPQEDASSVVVNKEQHPCLSAPDPATPITGTPTAPTRSRCAPTSKLSSPGTALPAPHPSPRNPQPSAPGWLTLFGAAAAPPPSARNSPNWTTSPPSTPPASTGTRKSASTPP